MLGTLALGLLIFAFLTWGAFWLFSKLRGGRGGPDEAAAVAAALAAPIPAAPSAEPIELRLPRGVQWDFMGWGIASAVAGIALFFEPGPLRSAWIAVPVGIVLLLAAIVLIALGWRVPHGQLIVSPAGMRQVLASGSTSIEWSQVAEVAVVRTHSRSNDTPTNRFTFLVVTDVRGQRFMREPVPLGPAEAWQRLLDSVPAWSGKRIAYRSE